jgi:hypothetical protein
MLILKNTSFGMRQRYFKIIQLYNRFRLLELKFLFNLFHNHINRPKLRQRLNFKMNPPSFIL